MSIVPLEHMRKQNKKKKQKKKRYSHDLLDVINNRTKVQLSRIRKKKKLSKMFHSAVTLKYNESY